MVIQVRRNRFFHVRSVTLSFFSIFIELHVNNQLLRQLHGVTLNETVVH